LAALEKQAKNKEKQRAKVDILRASIIAKESESLRFFLHGSENRAMALF